MVGCPVWILDSRRILRTQRKHQSQVGRCIERPFTIVYAMGDITNLQRRQNGAIGYTQGLRDQTGDSNRASLPRNRLAELFHPDDA